MNRTEGGVRGDDLSGMELGGYRLLHRLGSGGMADVWLAEQRSLGRHVAVKTLKRDRIDSRGRASEAGGDASIARFEQEARAAAALIHGNIVQIHEIGCVDGIHFIAEEYVRGPTLKDWLADRGPLSAAEGLSLLSQVAAALEVAFRKGVVHRDIKPDNLLVTTTGEVKVADFGLARVVQDAGRAGLTQEGFTLGTPLYMSPEQVEGRPVDGRSDLYSLGATAYHLFAGTPPFSGETSLAVALAHVRDTVRPLAEVRPDLPGELCGIVDRLLAKAPEARFQQPTDLLHAIERAAEAAGIGRMQGSLAWPEWEEAAGGVATGVVGGAPGRMVTEADRRRSPAGGPFDVAAERRAATLRLAVAMEDEQQRHRAARRFWVGTLAASVALFAVGYALGRGRTAQRPRRPPRP